MMRKLLNAALGFGIGIFTLPLILAEWPFIAARLWNDTEERKEENP